MPRKKTIIAPVSPPEGGEASPPLNGAPLALPVSEHHTAEPSSPLPEPEPQLAPDTTVPEAAPPIFDLALAPPVAQPVALTVPTPEPTIPALLERIEKLEEALAEVQDLQGIEQRITERVTTQLRGEKPTPTDSGSPKLSKAAALLDAGKHLIPSLVRADKPSPPSAPPPHSQPQSRRMWLLWEAIAEARVIVRMYVDPRWSLSWMGRTVPPVLLVAFLLVYYWVPFTSFYVVGPIIERVVQLVIAFVLFKVLGHEARRYREKAPDLPPSLRL
jgi:hypothetical protein